MKKNVDFTFFIAASFSVFCSLQETMASQQLALPNRDCEKDTTGDLTNFPTLQKAKWFD